MVAMKTLSIDPDKPSKTMKVSNENSNDEWKWLEKNETWAPSQTIPNSKSDIKTHI